MNDDWVLWADLSVRLIREDLDRPDPETLIMLRLGRRGEPTYAEQTREVSLHDLRSWSDRVTDLFDQRHVPRKGGMETFGRFLATQFDFKALVQSADFHPSDKTTVTITTPVSGLPWDLLWLDTDHLAHRTPLGLIVPTPGSRVLRDRSLDRRTERFLHVIGESGLDPIPEADDQGALEAIAEKAGLRYLRLRSPTALQLGLELQDPSFRTAYFHFSGHISHERLQLSDQAIITGRDLAGHLFPAGAYVVFLNGCDRQLDLGRREVNGHMSLLSPRTMANWCLGAGVQAIIAPRSRIDATGATRAATEIWSSILGGATVGAAVRDYRVARHKSDSNDLGAYSYVAYGDPRFARPKSAPEVKPARAAVVSAGVSSNPVPVPVEVRSPYDALLGTEILTEAAAEAGLELVKPHHLIAALSRRWALAFAFHRLLGGLYIYMLHQFRNSLGVMGAPPPGPPPARPTLSPETRRILDEVILRGGARGELEETALLAAVVERDEGVLEQALDALESGPRETRELVAGARAWVEQGRRTPQVIVNPAGQFAERFLPGLLRDPSPPSAPLTTWRLFGSLLTAIPACKEAWVRVGLPEMSRDARPLCTPFYFHQLAPDGQVALGDVVREGWVTPGSVLASLSEAERWSLESLRDADYDGYLWLTKARVDDSRLRAGLEAVWTRAQQEAWSRR